MSNDGASLIKINLGALKITEVAAVGALGSLSARVKSSVQLTTLVLGQVSWSITGDLGDALATAIAVGDSNSFVDTLTGCCLSRINFSCFL